MIKNNMEKVDGKALDEQGERWRVECPGCGKELKFKGWFDCTDGIECDCGCQFLIGKVWLNDKEYIK